MDELRRKYSFRIDAFTPDTLSMGRLASYMGELARLVGESEHVHFDRVAAGSANLTWWADGQAVPKVEERLREAEMPDAQESVARPYREINRMLAQDNAMATLRQSRTTLVRFPGRNRPARIGPVTQNWELVGQLVRVGGVREAHAQLVDEQGQTTTVDITEAMARELAQLLYGPPLRVWGPSRWVREPDGEWTLMSFRVEGFEELRLESLEDTIERIRKLTPVNWALADDPMAEMMRIRYGEEAE